MNKFDTFTNEQKEVYSKIHSLTEKYEKAINPAFFVLNKQLIEIQKEIETVQNKCNHVYENGVCIVCGKEQENK